MAEAIRASLPRIWGLRAAYAGLFLVLMMFGLLPLETLPRLWAGPDLMLSLTVVWAIRRPELVPTLLIAALFLLSDLLQMRPPGLMAAIAVFALHRLKRRARAMRDRNFLAEWLAASVTTAVVLLGYRLALGLFLLDKPQLSVTLSQMVMTIAFYPVTAAFSILFFGLRRAAVGEVDSLGHRL